MADLKVFSNNGLLVGFNQFNDTDKVAEYNLIASHESKSNNSISITILADGFTVLVDNRTFRINLLEIA
ncbi:hypothetical protein I8748_27705 [Nostoc sp. CENA67]|uniref:Uncharacterized protein n=1 Tax=Amazonocrinis nigriterrae CENA67 TaxID=2794033 RepID=A0A8J7HYR6_9NOST|nr:hypothetical protein [Amazonocrinis nigriterrae]MBH8565908.1 hypothetical protein [Amazonocrinis nigriterrae CENA67]